MRFVVTITLSLSFLISSAFAQPVENICKLIKKHPGWLQATQKVATKWGVPTAIQLAIVNQESDFNSDAKNHHSSAYGYAQAVDEIWHSYSSKQDTKQSRTNFSDDVNFIGWYANRLHKVSNVPIQNAYDLYMAYHDGGGGYRYDKKHKYNPTKKIAAHVQYISNLYKIQLESC